MTLELGFELDAPRFDVVVQQVDGLLDGTEGDLCLDCRDSAHRRRPDAVGAAAPDTISALGAAAPVGRRESPPGRRPWAPMFQVTSAVIKMAVTPRPANRHRSEAGSNRA